MTQRALTNDFEVLVNHETLTGSFEHNRLGDEFAGRLWFAPNTVHGGIDLVDFDGCFTLPREVAQALHNLGYRVPPNFQ